MLLWTEKVFVVIRKDTNSKNQRNLQVISSFRQRLIGLQRPKQWRETNVSCSKIISSQKRLDVSYENSKGESSARYLSKNNILFIKNVINSGFKLYVNVLKRYATAVIKFEVLKLNSQTLMIEQNIAPYKRKIKLWEMSV